MISARSSVGDRVVAAMQRQALRRRVPKQLAPRGPHGQHRLDPEFERYRDLRRSIMGLHVAGVDMLEGDRGRKCSR